MLTTHRRLSALIAVVAGLTLVTACGGGGSDDSSSDDASSANDDGSNSDTGDGGGGGTGGDLDVSDISDGNYSSGTVQVEISGDYDGSADLQGSGASSDGSAFLTFADATAENQVSISLNPDEAQSQVAVTIGDVTTGGTIGDGCSIELSGDGDSGFSGDFSCSDVPAVHRTSVEEASVDVEGSFTVNK